MLSVTWEQRWKDHLLKILGSSSQTLNIPSHWEFETLISYSYTSRMFIPCLCYTPTFRIRIYLRISMILGWNMKLGFSCSLSLTSLGCIASEFRDNKKRERELGGHVIDTSHWKQSNHLESCSHKQQTYQAKSVVRPWIFSSHCLSFIATLIYQCLCLVIPHEKGSFSNFKFGLESLMQMWVFSFDCSRYWK